MSGATASDDAGRTALTPPPDAARPVRHPEAPEPGTPLGSHYDQCFGCGESQAHGLHLVTRAGEGVSVTAEFTVRPAHQGAPGLAHGGVLVSALDETLGSLNWLLRIVAVTGRLETEFVRPVPVGTTLHLQARCDGVAGRKIYSSGSAGSAAPRARWRSARTASSSRSSWNTSPGTAARKRSRRPWTTPTSSRSRRAFEVNP